MTNGIEQFRGFLMALDPIHVGTGAFRLGRVDLPIQREPGTNLPKIPGTTMSGMARAYAARLLHGAVSEFEGKKVGGRCAGQGKYHCGKCAVCHTFGTVSKKDGSAYAGTANLFDAQLVFFPVASLCGPIWLTSPDSLKRTGFTMESQPNGAALFTRPDWGGKPVNLGWLLVETKKAAVPAHPKLDGVAEWKSIQERVCIVPEDVFQQAVNSNLEVRTSVSIDQERGAAEDGGLFTYEAIPRGAWMAFDLVEDSYRAGFPENDRQWSGPAEVVKAGVAMAEQLGMGGMGTRGFGRMRLVSMEKIA